MIVLIVYDNRGRSMPQLAQAIAAGAGSVAGTEEVYLRTLEEATAEDLEACDALVLGSPNWSGIAAEMKGWFEQYAGTGAAGSVEAETPRRIESTGPGPPIRCFVTHAPNCPCRRETGILA